MEPANIMKLSARKSVGAVLFFSAIAAVMFGVVLFKDTSQPPNPVVLTFLGYTNNGAKRVYVFEITNRLSRDVAWSFRSDGTNLLGQPMEFTIGVLTELGGTYGGMTLDSHTSLRFAASGELRSGERVWFRFLPEANDGGDQWRYRIGEFLTRIGLRRLGRCLFPTFRITRVEGPVMP